MNTNQPKLSIIVVAHNMPVQALNTLYSLSERYQRDVSSEDYEVLVVENDSGNNLDRDAVVKLGENFHYQLRQDPGVSPAPAINEALSRCRGDYVGLLIDGARMLTPRVIKYALQALSVPNAVVAVPGYYLTEQGMGMPGQTGPEPQAILAHEKSVLAQNAWRENGYQLFRHARFSNGNRHGYMEPLMECNALFCERALLVSLGGADEHFNLVVGGALNLHLYRQVATSDNSQLIVLPGEGNFHQFHGGTTTITGSERDARVAGFKQQLDSFWPGGFKGIRREPILHGAVDAMALPFLNTSAQSAAHRLERFERDNRNPWEDEQKNGHST
jgi:hypothetical protein